MKKITFFASVCALFLAPSLAAQEAVVEEVQDVQYVEDATQGCVMNSFKDNWFITLQGGANVYYSKHDAHRSFSDRFSPAVNLYIGKWFTPVFGARIGVDWLPLKGMGVPGSLGELKGEHTVDGFVKTRHIEVGPALDLMVNLTNLFCGYHPGRVYGLNLYAGGGGFWTFAKEYKANGESDGYGNVGDRLLTYRAGLINTFNISKRCALSLDLRFSAIDGVYDYSSSANRTYFDVQAYLGFTYRLGKTEWNRPLVPVCPPAENCDALRARLAAADARIADLEGQLRDCLNRPATVVKEEADKAPLATIYYPIGVYRLTKEDDNVLGAVAEVMKNNSNTNYVLTGWADNYTGTDVINKRLRKNRVNGVYDSLIKKGVPASQLEATTNDGSLCDLGEKYVALDRAVTIEEK